MPGTDYLLNTEEVATRLGKSTKWVRDNVEDLIFAIRVGKEHRFSVRGLKEWIAEQRAVKMALALPPTRMQSGCCVSALVRWQQARFKGLHRSGNGHDCHDAGPV